MAHVQGYAQHGAPYVALFRFWLEEPLPRLSVFVLVFFSSIEVGSMRGHFHGETTSVSSKDVVILSNAFKSE
jgi:hypothetical protein